MARKTTIDYIDKKEFSKRVADYIYEWRKAKETGKDLRIPEDIGADLMKIVDHMATSRSYSNYTWLDMMKSQALETCIRYFHNYNPDKYDNAFGYFTMIVARAFHKVIKDEKQKHSRMMEYVIDEGYNRLAHFQSEYGTNANTEFFDQLLRDQYGYMADDESGDKKPEKKNRPKTSIEKAIEEDENSDIG